MSDIVERLRAHADRLDWTGAETAAREREAASEIERLRANNIQWAKRNLEDVQAGVSLVVLKALEAEVERLRSDRRAAADAFSKLEVERLRAELTAERERCAAVARNFVYRKGWGVDASLEAEAAIRQQETASGKE